MSTTKVQATTMERTFLFNGVALPDPDPSMSIEAVQAFYAAGGHADITTAAVNQNVEDGKLVVRFERAIGHKG
jgi:PRTRC genetic system protein C